MKIKQDSMGYVQKTQSCWFQRNTTSPKGVIENKAGHFESEYGAP